MGNCRSPARSDVEVAIADPLTCMREARGGGNRPSPPRWHPTPPAAPFASHRSTCARRPNHCQPAENPHTRRGTYELGANPPVLGQIASAERVVARHFGRISGAKRISARTWLKAKRPEKRALSLPTLTRNVRQNARTHIHGGLHDRHGKRCSPHPLAGLLGPTPGAKWGPKGRTHATFQASALVSASWLVFWGQLRARFGHRSVANSVFRRIWGKPSPPLPKTAM